MHIKSQVIFKALIVTVAIAGTVVTLLILLTGRDFGLSSSPYYLVYLAMLLAVYAAMIAVAVIPKHNSFRLSLLLAGNIVSSVFGIFQMYDASFHNPSDMAGLTLLFVPLFQWGIVVVFSSMALLTRTR